MVPVLSEHPLPAEANSFGKNQSGSVPLGNQDLKPANVKARHAPTCEKAKRLRCDTLATSLFHKTASEFSDPMIAHHHHDLTEVGIVDVVGNGQVE